MLLDLVIHENNRNATEQMWSLYISLKCKLVTFYITMSAFLSGKFKDVFGSFFILKDLFILQES